MSSPIHPLTRRLLRNNCPILNLSRFPKNCPTKGVRPYENPSPKSMGMLKTLLTKEAAAKSSVAYWPTIMLSASPTMTIPNCPMTIGSPKRRMAL